MRCLQAGGLKKISVGLGGGSGDGSRKACLVAGVVSVSWGARAACGG